MLVQEVMAAHTANLPQLGVTLLSGVLAEQLLLSRYKPGTTIVVDKGEEAGLSIHEADEKTPAAVEAG